MGKIHKFIIFGILILLWTSKGFARPGYLKEYPARWKDRCDLCHINPVGGGPLNAYGQRYLEAGMNQNAIAGEDTDGDGFTNAAEIRLGSNPADAESTPERVEKLSANARGGNTFLLMGFVFLLSLLGFAGIGLMKRDGRWMESATRMLILSCLFTFGASFFLLRAFLKNDFSLQYVARNSATEMPWYYKVSAFWAGQEGSLLFWLLILSVYSLAFLKSFRGNALTSEEKGYMLIGIGVVKGFFYWLLLFATSPFVVHLNPPAQGAGMNPLLQNPAMMFHPPTLYLGYVGFTLPFLLTMTFLLSGRFGRQWERMVRRTLLLPWVFQTMGIIIGGAWAYVELGWGGYWAWDPVENASLMPWLTATAFLHSLIVQEKTGLLKIWNVALISLTFLLTLFGTFITRSGLISSVHAFADTGLGPPFLYFIGFSFVVSVLVLSHRLPMLQAGRAMKSPFSREGVFLLNNWILLGITGAVLWGTTYPIISEWVTGKRMEVGSPFYNQITTPMLLILLILTGIGPLFRWRSSSLAWLAKSVRLPLLVSVIGVAGLAGYGIRSAGALLGYGSSIFLAASIVEEFYRGVQARKQLKQESVWQSFGALLRKNARQYGGYVVHFGIGLMAVGIIGSSFFKIQKEVHLSGGESTTFVHRKVRYERLQERGTPNYIEVRAVLEVSRGGERKMLYPARRIYAGSAEQTSSETAIWVTPAGDFYFVLLGWEEDGSASFQLTFNPLISLIWLGSVLVLSGGLWISYITARENRI